MNWKKICVRFAGIAAFAMLVTPAHTQVDRQNFWFLNNTGREIRQAFVSPHSATRWGNDVLGRGSLPNGIGTVVEFAPEVYSSCTMDFKIVFADGSSQSYQQGRNVCQLHAVQFDPQDSTGF